MNRENDTLCNFVISNYVASSTDVKIDVQKNILVCLIVLFERSD